MKICKQGHEYAGELKQCPICHRAVKAAYKLKNKVRLDEQGRLYRQQNKDKLQESQRKYRENNPEKCRQYRQDYYQKNKERAQQNGQKYYKEHKEQRSQVAKLWYQKNKQRKIRQQLQQRKERAKIDPLFKFGKNVRVRMYHWFRKKGQTKSETTQQILGCTFQELKQHLEQTWFQNYGTVYDGEPVHIDHIVPLVTAKTKEDVIALNHFTNLQYLTPADNLKKAAKLPERDVG